MLSSDVMLPRSTDVFVVGGGPAGLAAAIAARRRGFDVTVSDRAVPPIAKACGEGIMPDGVAAARSLGIALETLPSHPFSGIRFCENGRSISARFPSGAGLGIRRTDLHRLLVDRASALGVRMLWGTRAEGFTPQGVSIGGGFVQARWIVGADGVNSAVRRLAGLEGRTSLNRRFGFGSHYQVEPWTEYMELHWAEHCQLFVTPVARNEVCVVVISGSASLRLDDALRAFPEVRQRLVNARATSERGGITGSRRLASVARGNVVLVGDASGSVDAITGEGICLSFQHALALADALEAGDLTPYSAAYRNLRRRPELMASMMLLMGRRRRLRTRILKAMAVEPRLFARMLAMHVGEFSMLDAFRNGLSLGWQMVLS